MASPHIATRQYNATSSASLPPCPIYDDNHSTHQVTIFEAEFSLETAYAYVKPTPDNRDLNDIIRDAKDEKAERTAQKLDAL